MTMTRRILGIGILALLAAGCGGRSTTAPPVDAHPFRGVTLRVGIVGDPAIVPTVGAQRGEWEEKTGAKVEILTQPFDPATKNRDNVDILVFPGDRLGDLIDADALATIPDSAVKPPAVLAEEETSSSNAPEDPFDFADVLPVFRDKACVSGSDRVAFPLGGSALVLVYRRDLFEKPALVKATVDENVLLAPSTAGAQRAEVEKAATLEKDFDPGFDADAFKKAHAPIDSIPVPKTWEQLDALAKFFHGRDWNGDGTPDGGIALVTAEDEEGVGVSTFLARSAALGQHPDQFSFIFDDDTMEPQVASPPFVETLTQLRALEESGPKGLNAEEARKAFRDGKVAMLIDRAEKYGTWNDRKKPVPTGVAALPGSERVFDPDRKTFESAMPINRPSYLPHGGGWFAGITPGSDAKARDAALDFLRHVTGRENSARLLGDRDFPMLPTRMSQLGSGVMEPRSAPGVNPVDWARAVAESLSSPRIVPGLRIPRAEDFLSDLAFDHGDFAASTPESALAGVAKSWNGRNAKLGVARQLWHYRRTLNRPTPTDTPPPRDAK